MLRPLSILVLINLMGLQAFGDPPTLFPSVRGTREMVAAANNYQVEAGWRMLMSGGNAVDAGVAAILAAAVTEQSRIGLGGEMPALVKMKGKPVTVISGVGRAPQRATVEAYRTRTPEQFEKAGDVAPIPAMGLKSAISPGMFDGLILMLRRYGTKSFSEVASPAVELADGFPIGEEYVTFLKLPLNREPMLSWPTSKEFFYPTGEVPVVGSVFRSTDLAKTLRKLIASEANARGNRDQKLQAVRDLFYKGDIAKEIGAFSESQAGHLRYTDLANFAAEEDASRTTDFLGYTVHKPGFWTQGPVMLQALNILKGLDLKAMGHNSPQYLHTVIETVKLAFADRDVHYGDPQKNKIPEQWLLSQQYADERRSLIATQASLDHRPGQAMATASAKPPKGPPAHDTTCVNVVDKWGNMFSATPSGAWIPSVIAGSTGIPLSSRLQTFVLEDGHPNQLSPGKRPRVTLSPTMVTRNGEAFLAMSTPGGDNQDQAMLQVLLNILVFGMNPQDAVEAPRFQTEHFFASFGNHEFVPGKVNLESRFPASTVEALSKMGHKVEIKGPWSNGSAPTLIQVSDGVLQGAADPRRNRFVIGR
jgi:gamma-glutamyltranspeptidase / glutathione hydrolase